MTPKSTKFSLYFQIVHELFVAARSLVREGVSIDEIFSGLKSNQRHFVKTLTRTSLILVTCAIVVSELSADGVISVKLGPISIAVPEVYIAFVGAVSWSTLAATSLQIFAILGVQAAIENSSARLDDRRFLQARSGLKGDETFDFLSPFRASHLFKPSVTYLGFSSVIAAVLLISLLVPFAGAFFTLFSTNLSVLFSGGEIYLSKPLAFISLLLFIAPLLYMLIYFVPHSIEKNLLGIRWNFLNRIAKRSGISHPRVSEWLDD